MKMFRSLSVFILLLSLCIRVNAQLDQNAVMPLLKQHISTLASDKFMGRETGTKGEELSYNYIIGEFQAAGLQPKGTNGFLQPFPFTKSIEIGKATTLVINKKTYNADSTFFPLAYAANEKVSGEIVVAGYGINAPSLGYNDYKNLISLKGKIFVIEMSTPDHGDPHGKFADAADLRSRIDTAIAKGAAGVIFINSDKGYDNPKAEYKNRITPSSIPIAFVSGTKADLLKNLKKGSRIELETELVKNEGTGNNVIGYIDNGAQFTVIIGAHYDHLGMGIEGTLYRGKPMVHNGADDNASGTAALIELAKYLKKNGPKGNNYLFISFSGEEMGLLGSGHWTKNPTYPLSRINYMLNMDMVGRLKTDDPTLIINGAGTSDAWKTTFTYIKVDSLRIKTTDSGIGPSDHTSFYLKDIPVLHFFSGTHPDYHKPSDDEIYINYPGEVRIMDYMIQLIQKLDDKGKLTFIKTKDDQNEDAPRFKVTLGVVPDYAFDGKGMRIDGVTEGKPASKAGLKPGDVVVQLGDYPVVDMMSYMKALSKFAKGDKTEVKVMRDTKEQSFNIEF